MHPLNCPMVANDLKAPSPQVLDDNVQLSVVETCSKMTLDVVCPCGVNFCFSLRLFFLFVSLFRMPVLFIIFVRRVES